MEYQFPHQGLAECMDQFMLGPDLLIAPGTQPDTDQRTVELPVGRWRDETGQSFEGPQTIEIPCPIHRLPRFERLTG